MKKMKELDLPLKRIPKDEQTDRAVREIIREETAAREEKTRRLKEARLERDTGHEPVRLKQVGRIIDR